MTEVSWPIRCGLRCSSDEAEAAQQGLSEIVENAEVPEWYKRCAD